METKIRKRILLFLLAVLCLPFLQHCLGFITSGGLRGGFRDADDVTFTLPKWLDGSYQHQKTLYLNDKTGFRPDLVRLNNQVDFSFFDKCHAGWDVKGKNGMLFQWPYIDAYYGNDFIGYDGVLQTAVKLKAIQDTLSRLGKSLILVYAPNKARSYPELFSDDRVQKEKWMTNHDAYRHIGDSLGLNQVDMDDWFFSMKSKGNKWVFSKMGTHWTTYGGVLAGDSLMRYIEKLRNIKVTHPDWSEIEYTDKGRYGDDEVDVELNLIFPTGHETYAYPVIKDVADSTEKKPNVIYISDSYGFKLAEVGVMNKMNGQCERWSYFNQVFDINKRKYYDMKDYDWTGAIRKADCVILVYTSFNLRELGSGFIEAAYDYYFPQKSKV